MLMIAVKASGRMIGRRKLLNCFAQRSTVDCLVQRRFVHDSAAGKVNESKLAEDHLAEHETSQPDSIDSQTAQDHSTTQLDSTLSQTNHLRSIHSQTTQFHPTHYFNAIERAIEDQLRNKFGPKTLKVLQHDYSLLRQRISVQEEPLDLKHKVLPKKKEIPKSRLFVYGERECAVYLAGEFGFNLGILVRVLGEVAGKGKKIGHYEEENAVDEELLEGEQSLEGEELLESEQLLENEQSLEGEELLESEQLLESELTEAEQSLQSKNSNSSIPTDSAKYSRSKFSNLARQPTIAPFQSTLLPKWQPKSILDFGCGPACGLFAVRAVWPNCSPISYTGIDISQEMLDAGNNLIESVLQASNAHQITLRRFNSLDKSDVHDLVICSFALLDISRDEQLLQQTLRQLWQQTGKYLVIINKADREGWELTQKAKEFIGTFDSEAVVAAPCASPSLEQCSSDCACLFRERINTSKLTRSVWESKISSIMRFFSFVVLEKVRKEDEAVKRTSNAPRVVGIPKKMTRCVEFRLCTGNGAIVDAAVTPADGKQVYKAARKIKWGDIWLHQYRLQPKKEKQAN